MRTFKYTARSPFGANVDGVAEANTRDEAIAQLKDEGYIIRHIEEVGSEHDINLKLGGKKVKDKSLSILSSQLSIILEAGLPITRTLELVGEQTEDKTLKETLLNAANDVAAGYRFADSLRKHGPTLPTTFVESVRAGEESGNLPLVFSRLATFYRKQSETGGKVKSALMYPAFVMGVAVIVVGIIMVFAVPTFKTTFEGLGTELPLPTKILMGLSDFMVNFWWVIGAFIALVIVTIQLLKRKNEDFHLKWSELGTKIPVLGRVNRMNSASQYASTMSVMMSAGLAVPQAVEVTASTITNYFMGVKLGSIVPDLEAGRPLGVTLAKTEAYPKLVTEMTNVGEETGELEHTLEVVAEYYDFEVQEATARAIGMLEPMIIVFLAGIVALVLLAVYMPMFSMYDAIG